VKARGDNWSPPFDGWHYRVVGPGYIGGDWTQRRATMFSDIRKAKRRRDQCREEGGEAKVVRVWARLPKPRLPQWVDPTPLDAGEVEVWRSHSVTATRYVFAVERGLLCPQRFVHYIRTPDGQKAKPIGLQAMISMPPDVWIEAGLRAAAMLRKANR
jgi:hypothetical protein